MSIRLEAVRDKPIGFWMLDGPTADLSGYTNTATIAGAVVKHPALASGADYASIFSNTVRATVDLPAFMREKEHMAFSVECVLRPLTGTVNHQIFGHLNAYDGLVFDGTSIHFVTKYVSNGEARASYVLDPFRSVHVVAVHNKMRNSLYIDGVLIDEIDISPEQIADTYLVDGSTMTVGQSSGTGTFAMNALAVYNYPLSPDSIARHATAAKDVPDADDVVESFSGFRLGIGAQRGAVYLEEVYEYAEDWEEGVLMGISLEGDALVLNGDSASPTAGSWFNSFPLDFNGIASIYGVQVAWDGSGVTVETSLNNTTWSPVVNGRFVTGISSGFNPTNKDLYVRVRFDGTQDESYLESLTITGYGTAAFAEQGRTITRIGTLYERPDAPVIDYQNGWGIELAGGALTISPPDDSTSLSGPGTIELWARNLTGGTGVLLDAQDAGNPGYAYFGATTANRYTANGTVYVNGELITLPYTWRVGQWTLIHVAINNTNPTVVHIGENYQGGLRGQYEIGSIVLYDERFDATTIQKIYQTYTGRPASRIIDNSLIRVSQQESGALIYAADWSIQSVG